ASRSAEKSCQCPTREPNFRRQHRSATLPDLLNRKDDRAWFRRVTWDYPLPKIRIPTDGAAQATVSKSNVAGCVFRLRMSSDRVHVRRECGACPVSKSKSCCLRFSSDGISAVFSRRG